MPDDSCLGDQPGMNQSMGLRLSPLKLEDRRDLDGRNEKNTGKKVFFPLAGEDEQGVETKKSPIWGLFADRTGLEPATSAVTGRHSNQLNYRSKPKLAFCLGVQI